MVPRDGGLGYSVTLKALADGSYAGDLVRRAHDELNIDLEIVKRPANMHTFKVLPRRWTVERTFGWWNWERRLSKDYERLPSTTEAWVHVTMTRLMVRRLARPPGEPSASAGAQPNGPTLPPPNDVDGNIRASSC